MQIYLDSFLYEAASAPSIPLSANATFTLFHPFIEDVGKGKHVWGTHTLKAMLTNSLPPRSAAVKADLVEITAQNGYTAGGPALTTVVYAQSAGLARLFADDFQINASGGSFGPFQYVVIYNDTASGKPLIGYLDYGATVIIAPTFAFLVNFSQVNGLVIGAMAPA